MKITIGRQTAFDDVYDLHTTFILNKDKCTSANDEDLVPKPHDIDNYTYLKIIVF